MSSTPSQENIDAVVDYLLRDQDHLLAQEVRHRVEELNQLLIQVQGRHMKVELETKETSVPSGGVVTTLDVSIYKRI